MRTEIVQNVVERNGKMMHQSLLASRLVVERHHLIQDAEVTCLAQIGHGSEDEPERVVIESASDIIVAPLCQRLVLMVAATVRELG